MSFSNAFEGELLRLLLENEDILVLGDAGGLRGSVVPGSIYVALHTADPGETGDQTTSEATYTGYARKGVARNSTEWADVAGTSDNVNDIVFDPCTGLSDIITHFSMGVASSGASLMLWYGAVTPNIAVSNGITPQIDAGDLDLSID